MTSILEKAGAGLLIAAWLVWGANMLGDVLVAPKTAGADKILFAEPKTAVALAVVRGSGFFLIVSRPSTILSSSR